MELITCVTPVYTASTNSGCLKFTTEKNMTISYLFIIYLHIYSFTYLQIYLLM